MTTIISLLASLAQIALKVWGFFADRSHDEQVATAQKSVDGEVNAAEALGEVQAAKEARDNATDAIITDPDSLRDSDGFTTSSPSSSSKSK